jgi:hypothetical protein
MDAAHRSQPPHLRVQLTLVAKGRRAATTRSSPFHSTLRVGTHNFACDIVPQEPLQPGGSAVHCGVIFVDPTAALPHLPPGSMFELWESGRVGYGMVLAIASAA